MKLNEILELDCRIPGNKEMLQETVHRLPFFKDGEIVTVEKLEIVLTKVSNRYPVTWGYMTNTEDYYSVMIKRTYDHTWLKTVYGLTLCEVFSKTLLYMYGYIKNNKLNVTEVTK